MDEKPARWTPIVADEPTKNSAGMTGETDVEWVKSAPRKHGKQNNLPAIWTGELSAHDGQAKLGL